MIARLLTTLALLAFAVACEKGPLDEPPPEAPNDFRRYMLTGMPDVMATTNCECCNKPLKQCYEETIAHQRGACPDT